LSIARDQRRESDLLIVGENDRRFLVAKINHRHLPQFVAIAFDLDALVQHLGRAKLPRQGWQRDPFPRRGWPTPDIRHHLAGAAAQGDEVNAALVELGEFRISCQFRVEH
jgi:hypothetical protein